MAGRRGFTGWLMQYRTEQTAFGDLAREIARDTEWEDPASLEALESQLRGAGRPDGTIEVARRAWRRYTADSAPA